MAANIYLNQITDKRTNFFDNLYKGNIYIETNMKSTVLLCNYAQECIEKIFTDVDVFTGFKNLDIKDFILRVEQLKGKFTNSPIAHQAIRDFVEELGQNPKDFIFHAPRIRVVPDYEYLHSGMSYAYKAHRDTWYGGSDSQINVWMPIYKISPEQSMWINPAYFDRPILNSSNNWSVKTWIKTERWKARDNEKEESRIHPVPLEDVDHTSSISFAGKKADALVFSGAHLHGSNKNRTGTVRYSTDFRIIKLDHVKKSIGAVNVDNGCKDGSESYKDFYCADTLKVFEGL